ncbi:MAG: DUF6531 domain-containing protein, partial [Nevskiaceae bacterium]
MNRLVRVLRTAAFGLSLVFTGSAVAHHCTTGQAGYWQQVGGGSYVGAYNDPKWGQCVSSVPRTENFEEWVGAQYKCQGNYTKPNGGGTAFIRIYWCKKTSLSAGYCTWADAPIGSPSGHEDSISSEHRCTTCAAGTHWAGGASCALGTGDGCNYGACESCGGAGSPMEGNPIHAKSGNKFQKEIDYTGRGPSPLNWGRSYNSFIGWTGGRHGFYWRHSYDRVLKINNYGVYGTAPNQWIVSNVKIYAVRADGRELTFTGSVDATTNYQLASGTFLGTAPHVTERLEKTAGGFALHTNDGGVETYNAQGKLQSITDRAGLTQTLAYDANGRLSVVQNPFGQQLVLAYNAQGRVWKVTDPAGGVFEYTYDTTGQRLTKVTHPDLRTRQYLYENTSVTHLLTGIIDENGSRFATFGYGTQSRAVTSEHAGGVDKVSLAYNTDGTTTVTDALGTARKRSFATVAGLIRSGGTTAPCIGCGTSNQDATYDANGFLASRTDFNGNVTSYTYSARGLEESRTEAAGTAQERTITTQWHPAFRRPTQIDEPGRRTVNTYDEATGDQLTQTVTDLASAEARTSAWTYNSAGQVLTVDGPRTDVSDVTTYSYYECASGGACGHVRTVTNALGHATEVTSYDAHGSPLTIVDPNGVTTTLTYDARQRLKTRTVAGAMTTFDYEPTGLLDRVTLPDGSFLEYDHDAAHRLTDVRDSAGNRIRYTLDAQGNRTQEQVFDPAGSLMRSGAQAFDTLARLRQVKDAAGQVGTELGYDAKGNRTSHMEFCYSATAHSTTFTHYALNRIMQVLDAA